MADEILDVLILGGGFSGVAAARELDRIGATFRLVDAYPSHLGGRAFAYPVRAGLGYDHGAEYLGDLQTSIMQLVRELMPDALVNGPELRATAPYEVMYLAGQRYCFNRNDALFGIQGVPPNIGIKSLLGMMGALAEMTLVEMFIDVVEPWKSPAWVLELDKLSVEQWLAQKSWIDPVVTDLMRISIEALLSVEPSQISPFYLLWYTACNSGFMNEVNDDAGGPQQYWLKTGMSALAEAFAKPVKDRIDLGTKITKVDHGGAEVICTTDDGKTYRAKKLLVAVSPHSAGRIAFSPAPPPARQALFELPMGKTIKCQLFYKGRWWWQSHEMAYDGYVGGANYPVLWVMDNSPPDAETPPGNGPYVLMTFTVGAQVDALGPNPTDAAITKAVTDALVFLFDDPRAAEFKDIKIHRWIPSDPFVGGGPNTVFTPGLLSGEPGRLLNEPWGDKIFFASSENTRTLAPSSTSRTWHLLPKPVTPAYDANGIRKDDPPPPYTTHYSDMRRSLGYMDGALESGRFGAHVVAKSLGLAYDKALDKVIAAPLAAAPAPPVAIPDAAAAAALLRSAHDRLDDALKAPGGVAGAGSALRSARWPRPSPSRGTPRRMITSGCSRISRTSPPRSSATRTRPRSPRAMKPTSASSRAPCLPSRRRSPRPFDRSVVVVSPKPEPPPTAAEPRTEPDRSNASGPRSRRQDDVSPESSSARPRDLGRYRLLEQIGAGGMGVVYRALDKERGTLVALKTLERFDPQNLLRLKTEFRSVADVVHDNLVLLHELSSEGDESFFTMELIDGHGFVAHVRGQLDDGVPLDPPGLARLRAALLQLATGVAALHAAGKLHRDLKPGNVMVTRDGRVVILDFGLVTDRRGDRPSGDEVRGGTPGYMAPEQTLGDHATTATDWFGVGVMLYEALTGYLPQRGPFAAPKLASERVAGVPPDLDALSMELRRPLPADRPEGAEVLRLVGAVELDLDDHGEGTRLVGRAAELAALEAKFFEVSAGGSSTVYLHGRSGTGKSALVRAFLDTVRTASAGIVLEGRCYERETVPYKAFDTVIDGLARHLARLDPSEAALLVPEHVRELARVFPALRHVRSIAEAPEDLSDEIDPNEQQRRAFRALKDLVGRIAARTPLVIGIDDLQWGDLYSARLLDELLAPPACSGVLLLATYRSDEVMTSPMLRELLARRPPRVRAPGVDSDVVEIALGPLLAPDAEQLALALLHREDGEARDRAREIALESQGNPFFVEQLARHAEVARDAGPVSVDALVLARLARLAPTARRVLELVAVTGRPVAQGVVAAAAGAEADAQSAFAVLRSSFLVRTRGTRDHDPVESYHDRIREAVVGNLSPDARAALHASLAAALERTDGADPEELASHLIGAGEPERARRFAIAAAERAEAALAFERAADLYRIAASCDPPVSERVSLERRRGDALVHAGRCAEAAPIFLAAASDAVGADAVELRRRAAEQLLVSGQIDEGIRVLGPVLEDVGLSYPATPGRAMAAVIARMIELEVRGFRFKERPESAIPRAELQRLEVCWSAGKGLLSVDSIRAANFLVRTLLLALQAGEPRRIARGLAIYGMMTVYEGAPRGAKNGAHIHAQAERNAAPVAEPYLEWVIAICRGTASMSIGRFREGLDQMESGIRELQHRCAGVEWECAVAISSCFNACLWLGEVVEIAERAPAWRRDAGRVGNVFSAVTADLYSGFARLAEGDAAGAGALCEAAIGRWSHAGYHFQHWLAFKIQTWSDLYAGDASGARARLEREFPRYEASKLERVQLMLLDRLLLQAQVAIASGPRDQRSLELASRNAAHLERIHRPTAVAAARLVRGCVAAARADRRGALVELDAASDGFAREGVALLAACAQRRHGELEGGAGGDERVAAADRALEEVGIADPAAWTAMLAPTGAAPHSSKKS